MKKALFITHMLERNGAPIVLLHLIDMLLKKGYQADVISMYDGPLKEDLASRGITVTIIENPTANFYDTKKKLEKYDLVVANTLITIPFVLMMHGTEVPTLWWIHEGRSFFEKYKGVLSGIKDFSSNIRILSVSPSVKKLVKEYIGTDSDLIPFAVPEVTLSDSLKNEASAAWNFPETDSSKKTLNLILVGPFSYMKGQDIFADSLNELPDETAERLNIIFCCGSNQHDDEVVEKVNALSGFTSVKIYNSLPHDKMISLISAADFLVVNSRQEPMPTVAAEAWMAGTPAVLSDACGIGYYAVEEMRKLIYHTGNTEELASMIIKCLEIKGSDTYDKLVASGREIYDQNFTPAVFEKNIMNEITQASGTDKKAYKGKLICMVGVYDILDIFMYEMIKEFKALGYEIFLFDTSRMQECLSHLEPFLSTHVKAVITFNNLGFNMELIPGHNLWEQLGIPVINILMDHPFCHRKALDAAPSNAVVLCPDMNHMKYLERFYPEIQTVGFLPHGGKLTEGDKKPISDRKIDFLYAGNLSRAFIDQYKPDFSKYDFDAESVAHDALDELISDFNETTEYAIEHQLILRGIHLSDNELKDFIADMRYVDMLAVSHYREKTVRVMAEAGFNITLYGSGWEVCDWIKQTPNLDFRGRVSAYDIVDMMQDTKIVLSTMTWFKDGTHDRVYNGMLAGALAVTDASSYMLSNYNGREDIESDGLFKKMPEEISQELVIFKLDEIDKLPDRIRRLMSHPDLMQQIAINGRKRALRTDTWQCRADELDRDLLEFF
ncbi:MAG: glycosyltransferase [Candidatus Weimeria sp.]